MKVKVFIDGSSGTTGLRIADRLAERPEIELLSISAEGRKDVHERAKVINSADLAFLCLPDAASKEVMPLLRPDVKVLDTSTAFRTDAAWDYGFPELAGQEGHKVHDVFRLALEMLPHGRVLGGDAHGTCVQVADAHHHTAQGY